MAVDSVHETTRRFALAATAVAVAFAASGARAGSVSPSSTVTFVSARLWSPLAAVCVAGSPFEVKVVRTRGSYVGHRWDPRGERIALVSEKGPTWTLEVARPDGTERRRLLTARRSPPTIAPFGQPAWSPNGELIAFIHDRSLFVVRSDGHGLRLLLENGGNLGWYADPSWSPDGDRIFVVSVSIGPVDVRLVSIRPDGTGRRSERGVNGHLAYGAYSPDRTKVAWVDGPGRVHVAAADGSAIRTVVATVPWPVDGHPEWSADGAAIAYRRLEPGWTTEVFVADAATAVERRLTTNRFDERDVAWHPGAPRGRGRCGG